MLIYLAGPVSGGYAWENLREAISAADDLVSMGHTPLVPQFGIFWASASDRACALNYEEWMRMSFDMVEAADAVFRLPGNSPGADREVEMAEASGTPVFWSLSEVPNP